MGNKNQKVIETHHRQIDNARLKKLDKEVQRIIIFEVNKMGIKASVEAQREQFILAVLVFMLGLMLVFFGLLYIAGVLLYG
jgi:hypothetical protein